MPICFPDNIIEGLLIAIGYCPSTGYSKGQKKWFFLNILSWWRHQMETFSALLAHCAWKSPVTGEFPSQRPVTRNFDVFHDLRMNKRLSKQSGGWWFKMVQRSLWRHCYVHIKAHFLLENSYIANSDWMALWYLYLTSHRHWQIFYHSPVKQGKFCWRQLRTVEHIWRKIQFFAFKLCLPEWSYTFSSLNRNLALNRRWTSIWKPVFKDRFRQLVRQPYHSRKISRLNKP